MIAIEAIRSREARFEECRIGIAIADRISPTAMMMSTEIDPRIRVAIFSFYPSFG
ncbi:MAG TPA: hypothetical protein VE981_16830 [Planctomycetota bacterium]|nr:hypothetical protein [Planctomycetota bacterium]